MNSLKFDLYAMTAPKSESDLMALIAELNAELEAIDELFTRAFDACAAAVGA